jgi:hypothetical protein
VQITDAIIDEAAQKAMRLSLVAISRKTPEEAANAPLESLKDGDDGHLARTVLYIKDVADNMKTALADDGADFNPVQFLARNRLYLHRMMPDRVQEAKRKAEIDFALDAMVSALGLSHQVQQQFDRFMREGTSHGWRR